MSSNKFFAVVFLVVCSQLLPLPCQAAFEAFIPPKFKNIILYAPVPPMPGGVRYSAGNTAIFRLKIDQQTGSVTEIGVLRRAKQAVLNSTMVLTLLKWKFKPGTLRELDLPVQFDLNDIRPELKSAATR
jgi:hypothetical protein